MACPQSWYSNTSASSPFVCSYPSPPESRVIDGWAKNRREPRILKPERGCTLMPCSTKTSMTVRVARKRLTYDYIHIAMRAFIHSRTHEMPTHVCSSTRIGHAHLSFKIDLTQATKLGMTLRTLSTDNL